MNRPEQFLQIELFKLVKSWMVLDKYRQFIAYHVRNEIEVAGKKGVEIGKRAKEMGVMSGVPDITVIFPAREIHEVDFSSGIEFNGSGHCPVKVRLIPPKTVYIDLKAWDGKGNPLMLLNTAQRNFRQRVMNMGFEYHVIAAKDVDDMMVQFEKILKDNGVIIA